MASTNGPYFIDGTELRSGAEACLYPDLGQSAAPDAQMFALADGAMQAHHERTLITGLLQAANEAADHEVEDKGAPSEAHDEQRAQQGGRREQEHEQEGRLVEIERHRFGSADAQWAQPSVEETASKRVTGKRKREVKNNEPKPLSEDPAQYIEDIGPVRMLPARTPTTVKRGQYSTSTASALFRRPSDASRKYTRPPMSKMFMSLELSPENFLQLQSLAKNYMLDPAFPDRQATVGQRGQGDSELVKLRLWNCVQGFLEQEGIGERFFGPDVLGDEGAQRTMIWPHDKNALVSMITPLLRRMVTNERQRVYAVESRKGGQERESVTKKRKSSEAKIDDVKPSDHVREENLLFEKLTGMVLEESHYQGLYTEPELSPMLEVQAAQMGLPDRDAKAVLGAINHHLRRFHQSTSTTHLEDCLPCCGEAVIERFIDTGMIDHGTWSCPTDTEPNVKRESMRKILDRVFAIVRNIVDRSSQGQPLKLHINLLKEGKRLGPRRDVRADACSDLRMVVGEAFTVQKDINPPIPARVRALTSEGLVLVEDDQGWDRVVELAKTTQWMDNELTVLVELL